LAEIYRPLYLNRAPIIYTRARTAELFKHAANAFLAPRLPSSIPLPTIDLAMELATLGGAAWPLAARAQQSERMRWIESPTTAKAPAFTARARFAEEQLWTVRRL
jgi:hypothetical protein